MTARQSNRGIGRASPARFSGRSASSTQRGGILARGSGRIQKPSSKARGDAKKAIVTTHLADKTSQQNLHLPADRVQQSTALPGLEKHKKVLRTNGSISACSDLSLLFVTQGDLETDEDTDTIALNIMDHFLFSDNWLPALSYCVLHAASFLFASRLTGKTNSSEQVAESLGPETDFVQLMSSLAEDDESAAAIAYTISVDTPLVDSGYALLWECKDQLGKFTGDYAANISQMPAPESSGAGQLEGEPSSALDEIDFDTYEG